MDKPTKVYYSISEVSKSTQLPISTLRYWEEQFVQLSPYKNEKGKRFYSERDIELIKQIKFIRDELQITRIEAIQKELQQGTKKTDSRQRAKEILLKIRQQLEDIRKNI
jgi:DNA-binding transcriptional MerR regulator